MELASFAVNSVKNLTINFCFILKCTLLLFCTGARLTQTMRIQRFPFEKILKKAILIGICPIKWFFVVISDLITQSLWCVWHKNTIQVSDQFKSRKCGVETIKSMHGNEHSTLQSEHFLILVLNRLLIQCINNKYCIEWSEWYTPQVWTHILVY